MMAIFLFEFFLSCVAAGELNSTSKCSMFVILFPVAHLLLNGNYPEGFSKAVDFYDVYIRS